MGKTRTLEAKNGAKSLKIAQFYDEKYKKKKNSLQGLWVGG